MSYVVTLESFTPGQRYDGVPWTRARIEQATSRSGPFTAIETVTFTDPDIDPTKPKTRDFTTDLATISQGWFKVVFLDATGAEQEAPPVYFPTGGIRPSLEQIGALLRARTKASLAAGNNEIGTFDATTRPTGDEVGSLIDDAIRDLQVHIGPIPESIEDVARGVVKYDVAMRIELSYFPEQVGSGQSAYDQYRALYERQLKLLEKASEEAYSGEDPGVSDDAYLPRASFPLPDDPDRLPITADTEF